MPTPSPLHIREATDEERLEWAEEICKEWSSFAMRLNVYSEIIGSWKAEVEYGSLLAKATYMAEYLATKPNITLEMIYKENMKICPGYCRQLPVMMSNITERRREALKSNPNPAAETVKGSPSAQQSDILAREQAVQQKEVQITQRENAVKQKEDELNEERQLFEKIMAAEEQELAAKWDVLRKAEKEFIAKQNGQAAFTDRNTALPLGTSSNTGLFKLTPKPKLEDQTWWIKDDKDHPIAFYSTGLAHTPFSAIAEALSLNDVKKVAALMKLDRKIEGSNTAYELMTVNGYSRALAMKLACDGISPQRFLLAIHEATDINVVTLPACREFLEVCFNTKKRELESYNNRSRRG